MFQLIKKDTRSQARVGVLQTPHGEVKTPAFMPVGTQATVKTVSAMDLEKIGAQIMLSNAYHLYLRPGTEVIESLGGLHGMMHWDKPILTDSGGYQIFSICESQKITKEGWAFKSHLDGSSHILTPEDVIRIQGKLGSDIMMPLDECVAYPTDKMNAEKAVKITKLWLERSQDIWKNEIPKGRHLFGIVQGGMFHDLRTQSLESLLELNLPGVAIGGLSVGEPQEIMMEVLDHLTPQIPEDKPRYLMGVGYPEDLILAVERGVDMFDCVAPTRNGRNGTVFNTEGKLLIRNKEFEKDVRPIDDCFQDHPDFCHSRAYLRHLFMAREMLGLRLASLWNLRYFVNLLDEIRDAISKDRFMEYKKEFFAKRTSTREISHAV